MVRGCSPAVCNCRKGVIHQPQQGERKDAGGADFVPLPLTSKAVFTGVLIRYQHIAQKMKPNFVHD